MIRKLIRYTGLAILVGGALSACSNFFGSGDDSVPIPLASISNPGGWDQPAPADFTTLETAFLQSFEMEKSSSLSTSSVTPVVIAARAAQAALPEGFALSPSATVPVWANPLTFTDGTFSNYPEVGLTTAYTVTDEGGNRYRIVSTTTYPASNVLLDSYIEEYFVLDVDPLGEWGIEDPVVDDTGDEDPTYRERMEVHFDDGSVRYEQIVKLVENDDTEAGFAPFDVTASLLFPDFAYPDDDPDAVFSSVVVYRQDIATPHDYSFWTGIVEGAVLGVRFYTEHFTDDNAYYTGTTVAYERAVETFTTSGGTLADQLDSVFIGSAHTTLAESVLRKEVVFAVVDGTPRTAAVGGNTVMRTHVVDTEGVTTDDFLLQLLNDDAAVFADWDGAEYHIPSGDSAEEIVDADSTLEVTVQTSLSNPDGADLPLIVASDPAGSDLAILYTSIGSGFTSVGVTGGATNDIDAGDLLPATPPSGETQTLITASGVVAEFDGGQGAEVAGSDDPANTWYFPDTAGTVEAWVYVNAHADTAGIVHKGVEWDFSDEGYTLQFWGDRGNVAFGIVEQTPSYRYALTSSNLRLNTGKWYYLVGRWDSSKVYLDIYYDNNGGTLKHVSYSTNNTLTTKVPYPDSGPLVIGSQYLEGYGKTGFYGFDGRINGVAVSTFMKTTADLETFYTNNRDKTVNW